MPLDTQHLLHQLPKQPHSHLQLDFDEEEDEETRKLTEELQLYASDEPER